MSVAENILSRARICGMVIEARGDRLKLRSSQKPPDDLLAELQAHKPAIIALLQPSNFGWSAEDWQAFFHERAGIAEYNGDVSRAEAEVRAFEWCITEWLNQNPEPSLPDRCAWCAELDVTGTAVVPFGTKDHTWLHPECWNDWSQDQRERGQWALAAMGLDAPPKYAKSTNFPDDFGENGGA